MKIKKTPEEYKEFTEKKAELIANIASDEKYIRAEKIEHIKAELHDFQEELQK